MQVSRCDYLVLTNTQKTNGQPLNQKDLINVGYMAGRYGINLDGNLKAEKVPQYSDKGTLINVNSCTTELLENNLNKAGIKFNKLA